MKHYKIFNSRIMSRDRNFRGCWACRFKKRKCDETKPVCLLCLKHGSACCYDVILSWLPENIYVPGKGRLEVCKDSPTGRMSKKEFKKLTRLHHSNQSIERESFTISARRFRVYDNCVKSVHRMNSGRYNYDSKWVDLRLTNLLIALDGDKMHSGPFSKFNSRTFIDSRNAQPQRLRKMSSNRLLKVNEFFESSWPRLVSSVNNWCLNHEQYETIIRQNIGKCLLNDDFPLDVLDGCCDIDYWCRMLHELPIQYQSIIIFLLYLQNADGHLSVLEQWLVNLTSINVLDFPIIVYAFGLRHLESFIKEHLDLMLIQYKPQSLTESKIVASLLAHMSMDRVALSKSLSFHDTVDPSFLEYMENDFGKSYMGLEVI